MQILLRKVCIGLYHSTGIMSEGIWTHRAWKREWDVQHIHWMLQALSQPSLNLLDLVCTTLHYLTLWQLSDRHPECMGVCGTAAGILRRASLLKWDDVRLKTKVNSIEGCRRCNL